MGKLAESTKFKDSYIRYLGTTGDRRQCCGSLIIFLDPYLYPDPTFQEIPDPTQFLSKEAKAKILNKTEAQILILNMRFV